MKPSMIGFALAVLLLALVLPLSAGSAGNARVQYDQKKDTITIEAVGTGIEDVLSEIAYQTGLRILIDPEVQKSVTINLKDVPLESALHQIARGLSYALFYESGMRKQRVVGMRLVPKGQPGSGPLKELGRSSYQLPKEALSYTGGESSSSIGDAPDMPKRERAPRGKHAKNGVDNDRDHISEGQVEEDITSDDESAAELPVQRPKTGRRQNTSANGVMGEYAGEDEANDRSDGSSEGMEDTTDADVPSDGYGVPASPGPGTGGLPDATDPANP